MTRRILGVFLAIVLAVLGTAAVLFYVNRAKQSVADGQTAVTVLVASERIPAGTTGKSIRSRQLAEEVVMPASSIPQDTLVDMPEELDDLVLTHDLQPRQLLLRGAFGASTKLSGGISVPEKMLAVSVKLAVEEEVGGFVRPGSQIAVFGTFTNTDKKQQNAGQDDRVTQLLLPRVEVLAVGAYGKDGQTSAQQTSDSTKGGGTVTLLVTVAVTQKNAEKLVHAVRTGDLYLALLTDSSEVRPGDGVTNATLLK